MKKLIIFLILLFAMPAYGQVELARLSPAMVGGGVPVESTDYVASKGFIRTDGYDDYLSNQFAIAIYNSSGTKIATSSAVAQGTDDAWVEVSFTAGPTIVAGNTYYLVVFVNGSNYVNVKCVSGGWEVGDATSTWPDAANSISVPGGGDRDFSDLAVYIANTAGTLLVGDSNLTGKTATAPVGLGSNGYYVGGGYTAETL